ncbi:MAG: alginate export family protein [Deltaproteobacteria bacterium]|nr:alginate export family protein [Deltaproteobacteria bacterium]
MHHVKWVWLFFFLLVSLVVHADETAEKKDPLLKMGGEVRIRSESPLNFGAFTPVRSPVDDDSFVLLRVRPFIESTPIREIHMYVQPQFSRGFAQEESTIANTVNVDDFDLHQGYVDFQHLANDHLSFRLGRQELAYGDERLIGTFDWSNIGRSFDAGKVSVKFDRFWIDGFASWVQRAGGNQYFGGLYSLWDLNEGLDDEPYFLILRDNDGGLGGGALTNYTVGNRVAGTIGKQWDYGAEGALQFGESGAENIFAYAGHAHGGYTFDTKWKPRIGLEYNIASGDDAPGAGSRVETFNNLFPTNHPRYGYMDVVGWRNMHNPRFNFQVTPLKGLTASLDYHLFFLMEPADGLYQASGASVRAGTAGASHFAGQEIDALLKYKWNKYAGFMLGYSFFNTGSFFSDTGVDKNAHFIYAQTTVYFDAVVKE